MNATNNISDMINNAASGSKPYDPTYLNLEYIFNKILNFFQNLFGFSGSSSGSSTSSGSSGHISFFTFLLFVLAVLFIFVIAYSLIRIFEIRKKEKEHLHHEIEEYAERQKEKEGKLANPGGAMNQKWQSVLTHVFSGSEADWRIAIIEADTMLEEMLDQIGLKGENLGEKLKTANQEKFKNISVAWEAHIVRNKIAHDGLDFQLSQHEAKRVVALYEQVFREFGYI